MTVLDIGFDRCTDVVDATYMMKNTWHQFKEKPDLILTQQWIEKYFALTFSNARIKKIISDTTSKCNLVLSNMHSSTKASWIFMGC